MDLLKNGQIDQAFLYTLQVRRRPADDAGLRDRLEMDFDRGQGGHGGMLTGFRQGELVRQFEEGGGAAKVEFLGVQGWGYDRGGYTVTLEYRITTPAMDSEMVVTAVGSDDENGDRQWYAQEPHPLKQPVFTEEGRRMQLWSSQAREFGQGLVEQGGGPRLGRGLPRHAAAGGARSPEEGTRRRRLTPA